MLLSKTTKAFTIAVFLDIANAQTVFDVTIESWDHFNVDARSVSPAPSVQVPGKLAVPPGSGPFPALVIVNSSAGTGDRIWDRLLVDLPARGYAILGIQSFVGRGIRGDVNSRQGEVSFLAGPTDALYALRFLRARADIDPKRICVIGHSRGGQAAFNFLYFQTFLRMTGIEDDPFACNISINSGGHYRPESLQATGRPALVFIGEKDDVWHMDVYKAFVEQVRNSGNPVEIYTIKGSYHSLTSQREYCPRAQTAKECRQQVQYSTAGLVIDGRVVTNKEGRSICGGWGYHCGYGGMEHYPEVLTRTTEFLKKVLVTQPTK